MNLVDTHCHIHFPDYPLDPEVVIANAAVAGVTRLIAVGCTITDSKLGVEMASRHESIWSSIGLHPHEAANYVNDDKTLQQFRDLAIKPKVIAIGECGLDYHYMHSNMEDQKKLLRFQLDLAVEHDLPLIFHVRQAFSDFWSILDEYKGLRGVVHSFSSTRADSDEILARGLYVGLNGIMTFTKNSEQLDAVKDLPLEKVVLETDAPFLTPTPERGTICQPKHLVVIAEFLARLRNEELESFADQTTLNARTLFGI